ncbi:hypothetical protein HK096_002470 [Nowakowskiella sp. JEL0078]|nr:hypothetical protein HK096_002470 [Nowakowskiella sp. JEL0078]
MGVRDLHRPSEWKSLLNQHLLENRTVVSFFVQNKPLIFIWDHGRIDEVHSIWIKRIRTSLKNLGKLEKEINAVIQSSSNDIFEELKEAALLQSVEKETDRNALSLVHHSLAEGHAFNKAVKFRSNKRNAVYIFKDVQHDNPFTKSNNFDSNNIIDISISTEDGSKLDENIENSTVESTEIVHEDLGKTNLLREELMQIYFSTHFTSNSKVSTKDLMFKKQNISSWFRSFASEVYKAIENGQMLEFRTHKHEILSMHHILFISDLDFPPFINSQPSQTRDAAKKIYSGLLSERKKVYFSASLSSDVVNNMFKAFSDALSIGFESFIRTWNDQFVKLSEFEIEEMRQIHGVIAMAEKCKMENFNISIDEDTTVHMLLHNLITEMLGDDHLVHLWANGSSCSSRKFRQSYQENATGKKADFRVCSEKHEELFAEFKIQKRANIKAIYDFYKLSLFLQGAINVKSEDTSIQVPSSDSLEIFLMTLEADGIYSLFHMESCRLPKNKYDLDLVARLLESLYRIKRNIVPEINNEDELILNFSSIANKNESLDESPKTPPHLPTGFVRSPTPTPTHIRGANYASVYINKKLKDESYSSNT